MDARRNAASYSAVRPELVKGLARCSGILCRTADRGPGVARRLVTFLVSPRKVTKRRRPRHTRIPEDKARQVGGKELAPLL